jgi:hypothetical protein
MRVPTHFRTIEVLDLRKNVLYSLGVYEHSIFFGVLGVMARWDFS